MTRENQEHRKASKSYRVPLLMLAERDHMSDANFSRKLRRELPESEKQRLLNIIKEIAATQEAAERGE